MAKSRAQTSSTDEYKQPSAYGYYSDAIDVASETVKNVGQWGNASLDGARGAVRSRPLAACMATLTAGAIIGALLLR